MTLHVHRATRADRLVVGLGELLSSPLPDPFDTELVAVPTRGVERWLAQSLSHQLGVGDRQDGVCAGIDFGSPNRLVGDALAGVTGVDPRHDPWQPRQAVWPLLTVIDRCQGESWAEPLWRYLDRGDHPDAGTDDSAGRRFGTARHVSELFDSYATGRPQMIMSWLAGDDIDGDGRPLPAALAWQSELWRRLRDELDSPSPAERLEAGCRDLAASADAASLPARVSLFGPTRLPYATLAVLSALARHREVHLWLPHASPALWSRVAEQVTESPPTPRRSDDPTAALPQHRLLGYLGRDARELQLCLSRLPDGFQDQLLDDDHGPDKSDSYGPDSFRPDSVRPDSLLALLQRDLATDRALTAADPLPTIAAEDRSITVHAAHGPDRQVEVLRELLLGLLQDDPTLEPRDIVVMCPDIETFAPLISAAFGAQLEEQDQTPVGHPGHQLRVRLADRSLRQLNPLLQVLGQLFDLAESRVEASTIVDLCGVQPVARRFDLQPEDLLRLRELVTRSGVRWGFDPADRQRFAMQGFGQNTWAAGLDRMLLGIAMDEDGQHFLGTTLPMDDIDASDVDLVGRLAEIIGRLSAIAEDFSRRQPLRSWIDACRRALELITAVGSADSWQLSQAYGELARIADSAAGRDTVELTRRDARAALADLFAGRPSRANFRTGTVTVATLMPMRSVPHRVVCLLGLDDGSFPRVGRLDGDDLLAAEPWVGDRDRRSEDRQLMLDAITSTEESLIIIYSGADPRTNAARPPSVPLGELLDVLDQTAVAADGSPVREQIVHRHPLQPFDHRNFSGDRFSFDPDGLAGARATAGPRIDPRPVFSSDPLPDFELPELVPLADLISFFNHPVRAFLRKRSGLSSYQVDTGSDEMPIALDHLQSWSIGDRMLRLHLGGIGLDQLVDAEWRRGELPPRLLGQRTIDPVAGRVAEIAGRAQPLLDGDPTSVDIAAQVEVDGCRHVVTGTIPGVYGEQSINVQYSRLGPKHRLQAWLRLLALTTTDPQRWRAISVGRGTSFNPGTSTLGPIDPEFARLVLADLVELYRTGMTEPLALPPGTASEYARIRLEDKPIRILRDRLRKSWEDERDQDYEQFFGAGITFEQLTRPESRAAEERGSLAEPSRFGTLARRVWHPLLISEELS